MRGALELGDHGGPIPASLAGGGRLFQDCQHAVAEILAINRPGSRSGRIAQSGQAALDEALPPLDDGVRAGVAFARNDLDALAHCKSNIAGTPGSLSLANSRTGTGWKFDKVCSVFGFALIIGATIRLTNVGDQLCKLPA